MTNDLTDYIAMLEAAISDYIKEKAWRDGRLDDSVPDFIPLLFKAGYNAGFEACRATA